MKPWEQIPHVWKTESSFWTWVKGVIRKGWSKHPVKLEFIKKNRRKIKNPNPRGKMPTVYGGDCARCGKEFVQADLEVDHLGETASLTKESDLENCVKKLLLVSFDDLQFLCKPCHGIRTYAQVHKMTEEEAIIAKEVARFVKLSSIEQKKILTKMLGKENVDQTRITSEPKRKEYYAEILKGEKDA